MNAKIIQIGNEVVERTGIDFKKYRTPELLDSIAEISTAVLNPVSLVPVFLKALIIVFFVINSILSAWWFAAQINMLLVVFLFVFGNIGIPFMGIPLALMNAIKKLNQDIVNTLNLAMDITKEVINDLCKLNLKNMPPVTDLLKGVIFVVLIPSLEQLVQERIKVIGKPVLWVVENALYHFSNAVSTVINKFPSGNRCVGKPGANTGGQRGAVDSLTCADETRMANIIETAKSKIESILSETVTPKVIAPVKFIFLASAFSTAALLMSTYWVFA